MYKIRTYTLVAALLSCLFFNSANAALVELIVTGDITSTNGSTRPTVGSSVTIRALYDNSIPDLDLSGDINKGYFFEPTAGGATALVSTSVTTELGTIEFVTSSVSSPGAVTAVTQTLAATQQIFYTSAGSSPFSSNNGFSGVMGNVTPTSLDFNIVDLDSAYDYLFSDPNVLFSGNSITISGLTGLEGGVNIYNFAGGAADNSSIFTFNATSLSVNPVPIPASVWLFCSGLIGLISMAKRRKV
ncbi:MAG TPA: hypothetical protein ENI94_06885 [Gammaproteobacteria bacterium]|nr:hypothetical protein [Gammaproteobacteria bacterium]